METILNSEELYEYINDEDKFEDFEYINLFASFQEPLSNNEEEDDNIYFSLGNNYENSKKDVLFEIKNQIENNNNQINNLNYEVVKKTKINKKNQKRKEKEFKSKINVFENIKDKKEKINYYMNASERKQRKIMKILDKKKERMKYINICFITYIFY